MDDVILMYKYKVVNNLFIKICRISKKDYSIYLSRTDIDALFNIMKHEISRSETILKMMNKLKESSEEEKGDYNVLLINIFKKIEMWYNNYEKGDIISQYLSDDEIDTLLNIILIHLDDIEMISKSVRKMLVPYSA